jgi:hypothetical protein
MATRVRNDDSPFWQRRSFFGEYIKNSNWIIAAIFFVFGGIAIKQGWVLAGVLLIVAGTLSFVWNEGVAKTATIIGGWIVAGVATAFVLSYACGYAFGMPAIGYFVGLAVGLIGVMMTID